MSATARGAFLKWLSLQSPGSWCRIKSRSLFGQMSIEVDSLLRSVRGAAHRGSSIAAAMGSTFLVAIALLALSVAVLATEARLPNAGQNTSSWHTSKSSRMAECGGDELAPVQTDDSRPTPRVLTTAAAIHDCLFPIELPLPELVGVPQAHGLRAPPHI